MVNQDENNGRYGKQTLEKTKRSLSIQEILSKECKVGLATLLCQKNESKLALGLFITKKSNKIQAQAHQRTARHQKRPPGAFWPPPGAGQLHSGFLVDFSAFWLTFLHCNRLIFNLSFQSSPILIKTLQNNAKQA